MVARRKFAGAFRRETQLAFSRRRQLGFPDGVNEERKGAEPIDRAGRFHPTHPVERLEARRPARYFLVNCIKTPVFYDRVKLPTRAFSRERQGKERRMWVLRGERAEGDAACIDRHATRVRSSRAANTHVRARVRSRPPPPSTDPRDFTETPILIAQIHQSPCQWT